MSELRGGLGGAAMSSASDHSPLDQNELEETREDPTGPTLFDELKPMDDEEDPCDGPKCKQILEKNSNSLKLLLVMAIV